MLPIPKLEWKLASRLTNYCLVIPITRLMLRSDYSFERIQARGQEFDRIPETLWKRYRIEQDIFILRLLGHVCRDTFTLC